MGEGCSGYSLRLYSIVTANLNPWQAQTEFIAMYGFSLPPLLVRRSSERLQSNSRLWCECYYLINGVRNGMLQHYTKSQKIPTDILQKVCEGGYTSEVLPSLWCTYKH